MTKTKKRILTGDRPTGALHLGHYLGSIQNRIKLQDEYDCFFIIADLQVFTDHIEKFPQIEQNLYELMADYLALGLKPSNNFFLQSTVTQLSELSQFFSFLVSTSRLERNPTIKSEMGMYDNNNMSLGFLAYPVSQAADILAFHADLVPVGRDQLPHIEQTREIAKKFNSTFSTEVFNLPSPLLAECPSLIGTDGKSKMSKSLSNAIFFKDTEEELKKKVMSMYTDPNRKKATDPGDPSNNPVFIYHRFFNSNVEEVKDLESRYRKGDVGDVEVKTKLFIALNEWMSPIRERRMRLASDSGSLKDIVREGSRMAQEVAASTLNEVKEAMKINFIK